LTLQAGLLAYTGARVARAFMDQTPASGEARPFAAPHVPLEQPAASNAVTVSPNSSPASAASPRGFALEEIVDPWQSGRTASRSDELLDPWRESQAVNTDPELVDPWRGEPAVAALTAPGAASDWDTSVPELLNPWPAALVTPSYDLPELIDPWATKL
jgi:hypothetical protein